MVRGTVLLFALLVPLTAHAVPGPDSTAVVYRIGDAEGAALAHAYATARAIPDSQVCGVDPPVGDDMTLADYQLHVVTPLQTCLAGSLARIEALVVIKGVPLRVAVPTSSGDQTASTTAALAAWTSTVIADGTPLVGHGPGATADCGGSPCLAAAWNSPYTGGTFHAGYSAMVGGVHWTPLLVTRLDGRTYTDAMKLVTSALTGETMGGARGTFLLMDGADAARGALDTQYPTVLSGLTTRGFTDAREVPFASDLTGQSLAALFVGTASLGTTIEGNTYLPGSIVDNLTSYGAVPANFAATGESQVSIARWVAMGVAGVHGTVEEPLNNCFPSRGVVLDYVDGATLGEAYFKHLPYAYWRNLVVGDVMAAPYATRPHVTITGATDMATVSGATPVHVDATSAHGIASIAIYVDGVEAAHVEDGSTTLDACLGPFTGSPTSQILAVAQAADDGSPAGFWQPKGWSSLHVHGAAGATSCAAPDAGVISDAGTDAAIPVDGGHTAASSGCSCNAVRGGDWNGAATPSLLLLALVAVRRKREG